MDKNMKTLLTIGLVVGLWLVAYFALDIVFI